MMAAVKPRPRRVDEIIVGEDVECQQWLNRLSLALAMYSSALPPPLRSHVRKTLDEFSASKAAGDILPALIAKVSG